jgi:hypothetical protein
MDRLGVWRRSRCFRTSDYQYVTGQGWNMLLLKLKLIHWEHVLVQTLRAVGMVCVRI